MTEFEFNFDDYYYGSHAIAMKYKQEMKHPQNRRQRLELVDKHEKQTRGVRHDRTAECAEHTEGDSSVSSEFEVVKALEEPVA